MEGVLGWFLITFFVNELLTGLGIKLFIVVSSREFRSISLILVIAHIILLFRLIFVNWTCRPTLISIHYNIMIDALKLFLYFLLRLNINLTLRLILFILYRFLYLFRFQLYLRFRTTFIELAGILFHLLQLHKCITIRLHMPYHMLFEQKVVCCCQVVVFVVFN